MATLSKQQVSPIQIYQSRNFKGLSSSNRLSNAYLTEPQKIASIMAYASGYQDGNVLSLLTGGIGNVNEVTNREYEWDLHSESDKLILVAEDSPSIAQGTPGQNGMPFEIILSERWFDVNDNIVADDSTQLHILEEPEVVGPNAFKYIVQHNEVDPEYFVDPEVISKGARFCKDYTTVAEYSDKGGGVQYATPYRLRNQLTTMRKTYEVTRNAAKAVMIIELTNPHNPSQKTKLWTQLAEWKAMSEWYKEIDRSMIYSIYNKDNKGTVNLKDEKARPIYHGAGIRQQIAPSNVRFYTKLTYKVLDDFLLNLSYNADKWGGNHHFVALTGKMGMREFDRAIQDYASGNGITVDNHGTFITGSGDELEFTGYFKTVHFLNGVSLTVKEFPPYDDIIRNRALHPVTKKPLESYRFTILNFGHKDGKANIRKVALKDSEMSMWHVAGSVDPSGVVANSTKTQRSSGIDGYTVHYLSECGVMVEDPTSCGELILAAV
jgi:hypothetical protein